jgi:hypothetical protein
MMTQLRAPFPRKPRDEVAASLRQGLVCALSDVRHGRLTDALQRMEDDVIAAVCDLEAWSIEDWERIRSELEAARSGEAAP